MRTETPRESGPGTRGASTPLARTIDTLMRRRKQATAQQSLTDRLAARVAAFTGGSWSVFVHALVFGLWHEGPQETLPGRACSLRARNIAWFERLGRRF
jgi:hypothetical protein